MTEKPGITSETKPRTRSDWLRLWLAADTQRAKNVLRPQLPPAPVEAMGCRFIAHPADNFTELKLWETGLPPEHEATRFLCDALRGLDPVIVDVGANAGAFFLPIHLAGGRAARSIVFEPNPKMRKRLEVNIQLNGLGGSVRVFDCAVGDRAGQTALHFPRNGNMGQGRIDVPYPHKRVPEAVKVQVRPLAECLAEVGAQRVDLLKVDVEGLEDRVIVPLLEGEARLWPKMIYFETAHDGVWSYPLMERLADCGYELIEQYDANALYLREG
ncbi:FkbM family methyltransferase [Aestuariivita boseongensis]|uniref:FkbM family methyltransferase n=1 Tax=Aestuariivita boseongensis TaxID=1470562 RepID=UPI001C12064B|nr:FkbM family methyltransferase [Aestuariivita boseongensis]